MEIGDRARTFIDRASERGESGWESTFEFVSAVLDDRSSDSIRRRARRYLFQTAIPNVITAVVTALMTLLFTARDVVRVEVDLVQDAKTLVEEVHEEVAGVDSGSVVLGPEEEKKFESADLDTRVKILETIWNREEAKKVGDNATAQMRKPPTDIFRQELLRQETLRDVPR